TVVTSAVLTAPAPPLPSPTANLANTAPVAAPVVSTYSVPDNHSPPSFPTRRSSDLLAILKTDNALTYTPGTSVTYTITVTNGGPSDTVRATVADTIPATLTGVTWTSATTGGASVGSGGSGAGNSLAAAVSIPAGAGH